MTPTLEMLAPPGVTAPGLACSRAVLRPIRPGSVAWCSGCDQGVKFSARVRRHQVIANVYVEGAWNRVEHYHPECYEGTGEPHGPLQADGPLKP